MKKIINKCPYNSSCSGQCTHRGCKLNKNNKRYCGHKRHHNCPLFIDWVKKARKAKIEGREARIGYTGDEDASS